MVEVNGITTHAAVRRAELTPAEVAARAGVSALHFYDREGLIRSRRTGGNQRRYHRDTLRRIGFIRVTQGPGIPLRQITEALESLPADRSPTKADWTRLSRRWQADLDARIEQLQRLRDSLDHCIGCGCLSLRSCALYNPTDELRLAGPGPQRLLVNGSS